MRCYLPALAGALLFLGGCATLDELGVSPRASTGDEQLVFLGRLTTAESDELDAIGDRLRAQTEAPRTPIDTLRYAMWQATPGHGGHAPEEARDRLNRLLSGHPPPEIEALIRVELRHLRLQSERAELSAKNQRLRAANGERQAEIEALQEQIQALTTLERRMGEGEETDGE